MTKLLTRIAAEYNEAVHGYARGRHFVAAFVLLIVAIWIVQTVLGDTALFRLLTGNGGPGEQYWGR